MSDRIIRLADCPPQPWKNGLGQTRELAVQPSASDPAAWDWRVSIAEVDAAAPFSAFPGIERTIVLLAGAGFTMTLDGERTHALTELHAPYTFPGEARIEVALADGPTRDFNVMVQRAHLRAEVEAWHGPHAFQTDDPTVLVYCAEGSAWTSAGKLSAGEAWRPDAPPSCPFRLAADSVALVVRILPRDAGPSAATDAARHNGGA